ncbi:hypothetical protein Bca101_030054 [Brassica carinata]
MSLARISKYIRTKKKNLGTRWKTKVCDILAQIVSDLRENVLPPQITIILHTNHRWLVNNLGPQDNGTAQKQLASLAHQVGRSSSQQLS